MSILSAQTIRSLGIIHPFEERTESRWGDVLYTQGLGPAGYDIRIDQDVCVSRYGNLLTLASSMEHFDMPIDVMGIVHDKSTWARRGLFVQNTIIEPGWRGHLTLELTYCGAETMLFLSRGMPLAHIVFHWLDTATDQPYAGKYQDQERGPQSAR